MSALIGVTTHLPYIAIPDDALADLKRHLLLFDKIFFVNDIPPIIRKDHPELAADLDWLKSEGAVITNKMGSSEDILKKRAGFTPHGNLTQVVEDLLDGKADLVSVAVSLDLMSLVEVLLGVSDYTSRSVAEFFRRGGVDAVSIHPRFAHVPKIVPIQTTLATVAQVSINAMPQPSDNVPLDQILRFKQDPDTKRKFSAFRRWIRSAAEGTAQPSHLADELQSLTQDYEQHMRVHELKINRGVLEIILTTAADLLEDTVKLRFGKLARLPFSLSHRKIALMEAELNAPGRELAYIIEARKEFR